MATAGIDTRHTLDTARLDEHTRNVSISTANTHFATGEAHPTMIQQIEGLEFEMDVNPEREAGLEEVHDTWQAER